MDQSKCTTAIHLGVPKILLIINWLCGKLWRNLMELFHKIKWDHSCNNMLLFIFDSIDIMEIIKWSHWKHLNNHLILPIILTNQNVQQQSIYVSFAFSKTDIDVLIKKLI